MDYMKEAVMIRKIFLPVLFVTSIIYLYFVTVAEGPIHADEITGILLGKDIFLNGNFLMKDWNLTTGITTIQLLSAVILTYVFGNSYTVLYVISALHFAVLVNVIVYIVFKNSKGKNACVAAVCVLILTIIPNSHSILNVCTHTLVYAACTLIVYAMYKLYIRRSGPKVYILAGIMVGALTSLNNTMLYYGVFPVILVGLLCLFWKKGYKEQNVLFIVCGFLEVIISKVCFAIWIYFRGEDIFGVKEVFVSRENLVSNLVSVISNVLYEFGIDVWGKPLFSVSTLQAGTGLIVLFLVIKGLLLIGKLEEKKVILALCLLSIGLINIVAYGVSSIPSYSPDMHLMELFVMYICAGFGIYVGNMEIKYDKRFLCLVNVFVLYFLLRSPELSIIQCQSPTQNVAAFLEEQGFSKGFATYWEMGTLMSDSEYRMTVAPIAVDYSDPSRPEGIAGGWKWAAKNKWLEQEGEFIVFAKDNPYGIHADKIIEDVGRPTQYLEVDDYGILIYEDGVKLGHIFR